MEYYHHSQLTLSTISLSPSSSLLYRPLLEHAWCTRRCPLITDISSRLIVGFQGERNGQRVEWIERHKITSLYRRHARTPYTRRALRFTGEIGGSRCESDRDRAAGRDLSISQSFIISSRSSAATRLHRRVVRPLPSQKLPLECFIADVS